MGLFESIFQKKSQSKQLKGYWQTLTAYTPTFTSWNGQLYESELVRSAVDARARNISKLRVEMVGSAQGKLKTQIKHRPNRFQTWSQFLYRTSTILDMHNTAFIVPLYNKALEIIGFYSLLPDACEVVSDGAGEPWLRYKFNNGNTAAVELDKCGILTKFQYRDDMFGSSNYALDDTMRLINMRNQGIQEAIKSSATYRFMAQASNFSFAEDLAKERQRFTEENFSKDARGGGLLLFPNTYQNIKQIESKPYTVDPEETKTIQQNVFNYFAVNENIIQSKAIGDDWSAFYESVIEPFAIQLSEVMTNIVFSNLEQSYGSEIIVTSNRLQYMSNNDKLNVSAQMADRGIMSINEIREMWNMPPVPGGDARTIRGEYYQIDENGNVTEDESDESEDSVDE